ncbi:hypothetical protein K491DRAFT_678477 [Lophiostoma macrostomum CBS 122681]|uniref:Uncharacterized protein n=1 Tax=Lophiostoma macrostomum CBS 122681 TaxID=1314788 RepID=A0A6A6TAQ0_9PLEO|nr:hypothetical protein K491DRAFT_678477 [Lophiostoma macrostomum CBS 122681]
MTKPVSSPYSQPTSFQEVLGLGNEATNTCLPPLPPMKPLRMESVKPKLNRYGVPIEIPARKPLPTALDRAYIKPSVPMADIPMSPVAQSDSENTVRHDSASVLQDQVREEESPEEDSSPTSQAETSSPQRPRALRRQETNFDDFLKPDQITTWEAHDEQRRSRRSASSLKSFSTTASAVSTVAKLGKRAKAKVAKQLQTSREQALAEVLSRTTIVHGPSRAKRDP